MPLQGTFDVLPFADVLELLAGRTATGRLHVRSRPTGANIYLEKGRLVGAEVGEQVIAGPEDVRSRLSDVCFELLEADRGSFEFNPDLTGMGPPTIDLEVGEVLDTARTKLEEWREIQTVVGSLDLHPSLIAELPAAEVTLSREQWRVLSALDGRRSVRAVARLLDLSDFSASRIIKALIEAGVVELDALSRPVPVPSRETTVFVDDLVEWAPEANGNGDGPGEVDTVEVMPLERAPFVSEGQDPPSANGERDAVWSGNVEDPRAPGAAVVDAAPPTPAGASAPPVPATPAPAPSKVRRQGLIRIGRKSRPAQPNS